MSDEKKKLETEQKTELVSPDDLEKAMNDFPEIPDVDIEKRIARGGMGVVYRGRQPYLDRVVAVKVLSVEKLPEEHNFAERFQREAKLMARLTHPNIVSCYQAGVMLDGNLYIVMEFIEGQDLSVYVHDKGPLNEKQGLIIIKSVAKALGYAYKSGIIHRDIKAENVLIQNLAPNSSDVDFIESPDFPHLVKLVDLGIARPVSDSEMNLTKVPQIMGTPSTMAPEQFSDPASVDYRADIYALGCVLYFVLTGENAYPHRDFTQIIHKKTVEPPPQASKLRPDLSKSICTLMTDLMQKDREHRPQSYDEIIERCDMLLNNSKSQSKNNDRILKIAMALVLLISIVFGGWHFVQKNNIENAEKNHSEKQVKENTTTKKPSKEEKKNTAKETKVVKWGKFQSLFKPGLTDRLEFWQEKTGRSDWAPHEESNGTIGAGSGRISTPIKGQWRLRGTIIPASIKAREFGIRCELPKGEAAGFSVQIITDNKYLVGIAIFAPDKTPGVSKSRKSFHTVFIKPDSKKVIKYEMGYDGKILTLTIQDQDPFYLPLESEPKKISLYVRKALGVYFKEIFLQLPE